MHGPAFGTGLASDLFGHAQLAAVEQVERLIDGLAHAPLCLGVDVVAILKSGFNGLGKIGDGHENSPHGDGAENSDFSRAAV